MPNAKRNLGAIAVVAMVMLVPVPGSAQAVDLPTGYMPERESQEILDKTLTITLDPDLSGLSDNERGAVDKLIEVGLIFERMHELMRHRQAVSAYEALVALDEKLGSPKATQNLIDLYYLAKGPIVRGLDNKLQRFLPVEDKVPGRNVYAWGVTREEIEAFLAKYPDARPWLLSERSVVRRSDRESVRADLAVLDDYPVLDVLHPGLRGFLEWREGSPDDKSFYACPHSVAFAEPLMQVYAHLNDAAELLESEDPDFSGYLRLRARDLLCDDYESGDAAWVSGRFKNLNAQIGAYEVYDDELYGVKAFYGLNVLVRDRERSDALRQAISGMQSFENSLPYQPVGWDGSGDKKKVREDIPVGVYHIVADFGQSRGTNTATILPNESAHARKYGRTILMRYNILKDPQLFQIRVKDFQAAVAAKHAEDLTADGGFYRTLWHEIGHYLGPDRTKDGRDLDEALEASASILEELKADLITLYLVRALRKSGYYDDAVTRAVYADGARRVFLKNKPSRAQIYETMELMQFNYYLHEGLFTYNEKTGRLFIQYDRFNDVVTEMLRQVLALQQNGNKADADAFIDRYAVWDDNLHGALAAAMKATGTYRYTLVKYAALERYQVLRAARNAP